MVPVFIRKGIIRSGPFHVYLNKSGIGVSGGVPGMRIGMGPRGSYVRMGKDGVYYRKTLSSRSTRINGSSPTASRMSPIEPGSNDVVLQDIAGATVLDMDEAQSSELTKQINEAAHATSLMPLVVLCFALIVTIPLAMWLRAKEAERRSVIVFYDINDGHLHNYQALVDAFDHLEQCNGKWSVTAEGGIVGIQQWKANAGASKLVRRSAANFDTDGPKVVKTNVSVPSLHHAKRTLFFLPDRVLVQEGNNFADFSYPQCQVEAEATRFIETERRPSDAAQVGSTWKYVNKSGGPDKRYKDNQQLPIMQYGELVATSSNGLHLLWQISRPESAAQFASAVKLAQSPQQ